MAKKRSVGWMILSFPFKLIFWTAKYLAKAIFYILEGLFFGIRWLFRKSLESYKHRKKENAKPKAEAKYEKFKELKKLQGSFEDFEQDIRSPGKIGIIIGARGSGKSAIGMRILENIKAEKTGRKIYAMGFAEEKMPAWINPITEISQITNDSFVLLDESGINFSSRSSMSSVNKLLTELLLIARHKNVSIIFIAQNSSNIEVNILRQADFLILKPSSLLQLDFERKIIRDIYQKIGKMFLKYPGKSAAYIYSARYEGFVKHSLPSFWSEGLSRSFSGESLEKK